MWKLTIVFLFLQIFGFGLSAQVDFRGEVHDVQWLTEKIIKIRQNSPNFDRLWKSIDNIGFDEHLIVEVIPKAEYFLFASIETERITKTVKAPNIEYSFDIEPKFLSFDRSDIEALPYFEYIARKWSVSDNKPAWSVTQESTIAHEIAEFLSLLKNDFCKYSCKCKSGIDSHDIGKEMENHVREAFGQKELRKRGCGDDKKPIVRLENHDVEFVVKDAQIADIKYK